MALQGRAINHKSDASRCSEAPTSQRKDADMRALLKHKRMRIDDAACSAEQCALLEYQGSYKCRIIRKRENLVYNRAVLVGGRKK